jgi:adenylosuccinate synthase
VEPHPVRKATAVIGAGYGDEGKGLLTDFFAARNGKAIVVRFNGGSQAGHTVVTPSGIRHVFKHFGSGALAGAKSFLSKFFVVNPMSFFRERAILAALGVGEEALTPHVDLRAFVSTPYDMMINQIAETARGTARHGSCGAGINETIERSTRSSAVLTAGDLVGKSQGDIARMLGVIRDDWMPARLRELGVDMDRVPATPFTPVLQHADIAQEWLNDALHFASAIVPGRPEALTALAGDGAVIFEGAQGLMLDMDRGVFPHVTRSNTGIKNVLQIAAEAQFEHLDIVYAHRAYTTRHGAGFLARETDGKPYAGIEEKTNATNTYQGEFRYGYLDVDVLLKAIGDDVMDADKFSTSTTLALTCLDQVDETVIVFQDNERHAISRDAFPQVVRDFVGAADLLSSFGPMRSDIATESAGAHNAHAR